MIATNSDNRTTNITHIVKSVSIIFRKWRDGPESETRWNCTDEERTRILVKNCSVTPPKDPTHSLVYGSDNRSTSVEHVIKSASKIFHEWRDGPERKTITKKNWNHVGCSLMTCPYEDEKDGSIAVMSCYFGKEETSTPETKTVKPTVASIESIACGNLNNSTKEFILSLYRAYGRRKVKWNCKLAKMAEEEVIDECNRVISAELGAIIYQNRQERQVTQKHITPKEIVTSCWLNKRSEWDGRRNVREVGCAFKRCRHAPNGFEEYMTCFHDNDSYDLYVVKQHVISVIGPVYAHHDQKDSLQLFVVFQKMTFVVHEQERLGFNEACTSSFLLSSSVFFFFISLAFIIMIFLSL
ncbi:hypothetical protein DICVIV_13486 [Dictyocaulus viviparus]|uniref:Uncharacterized protein n=1 Tax=Dictyocaulus viviparus TaxID=29172 RepID=A0A0D8X7M6_DICVI|nr:hypothetical protein DICVIV_13486 [Dictyocaulus viviparus]